MEKQLTVNPLPMIRVEFYGIPRARAGVAQTTARAGTLAQVLAELGQRYPGFEQACLESGQLRAEYSACLEGDRFVRGPDVQLSRGATLLILSADVGG